MAQYFTLENLLTSLEGNLRLSTGETGVYGNSTYRTGILNNGAKDFIRRTRALKTKLTYTLVADQQEYDLSTDATFLQIDGEGGVVYDGKRLEPSSIQMLDLKQNGWRDMDSDTPTTYYPRAMKYLGLVPAPSSTVVTADSSFYVYALKRPVDMSATTDTPFSSESIMEEYDEAPLLYASWKLLIRGKQFEEAMSYKKEYAEMVRQCVYDLASPEDRSDQLIPMIYNRNR